MLSHAIFTLQLALLVKAGEGIVIRKCCSEFHMVSGDGKSCVQTDWPQNATIRYNASNYVIPPLDENWMHLWFPPGAPLENIREIIISHGIALIGETNIATVNTSSTWNRKQPPSDGVRRTQAVFNDRFVVRPKPGGGGREAYFCVDAALPPLAPYALVFKTKCSAQECVTKCCKRRHVLVNEGGIWDCKQDGRGNWSVFQSTIAKAIDEEFPFATSLFCPRLRRASSRDLHAAWARSEERQLLFSTWRPCFDYYRGESSLEEGLFYCEYPRGPRGVYWLLRPLCIASWLLVLASLLSVACDKSMRRKIHGWCLGCHAACLLGFNTGQVVYYAAISDIIDNDNIPSNLQNMCTHFALFMYFLLTASWSWLTTLCVNMALGFRLQAASPNRRGRNKFLALSAFAWGLPIAMTVTCCLAFTPRSYIPRDKYIPWYSPSLMEARVCYQEPYYINDRGGYTTVKHGTSLFYYGPVGCLVLINLICNACTLRRVQYLRRGNSVLRREEDQAALRRRPAGANTSAAANVEAGNKRMTERGNGGGSRTAVDSKTIKLYIKMLWMTGVIEIVVEITFWYLTNYVGGYPFLHRDYHFLYRASGYVTDIFRATCVAWLAAPDGGYLRPILRRLRGKHK